MLVTTFTSAFNVATDRYDDEDNDNDDDDDCMDIEKREFFQIGGWKVQ